MSDHAILCGDCKGTAQVVREDDGSELVRCSGCAKTATRDEALSEAGKYARSMMAKSLNSTMKSVAAKSKFITYKPGKPQTTHFEWILDGM